ncbi:hypothetical protein ACFX2H_038573 [Malus domestica]
MTVQEKENNEGWFLFMQMDLELLAARSVTARPEFQVVNKYRLPDGNTTAPMDLAYTGWMTVCTCYAVNGSRVVAGTIKPLGSNSSGVTSKFMSVSTRLVMVWRPILSSFAKEATFRV